MKSVSSTGSIGGYFNDQITLMKRFIHRYIEFPISLVILDLLRDGPLNPSLLFWYIMQYVTWGIGNPEWARWAEHRYNFALALREVDMRLGLVIKCI